MRLEERSLGGRVGGGLPPVVRHSVKKSASGSEIYLDRAWKSRMPTRVRCVQRTEITMQGCAQCCCYSELDVGRPKHMAQLYPRDPLKTRPGALPSASGPAAPRWSRSIEASLFQQHTVLNVDASHHWLWTRCIHLSKSTIIGLHHQRHNRAELCEVVVADE